MCFCDNVPPLDRQQKWRKFKIPILKLFTLLIAHTKQPKENGCYQITKLFQSMKLNLSRWNLANIYIYISFSWLRLKNSCYLIEVFKIEMSNLFTTTKKSWLPFSGIQSENERILITGSELQFKAKLQRFEQPRFKYILTLVVPSQR